MVSSRTYPDWASDAARDGLARPGTGRGAGARHPAGRIGAAGRLGRLLRVTLLLTPTILAGVYYAAIATPRFESEARFVIRTASKSASMLGGITALLQLAGLSGAQDDAYAVRDYLISRDGLHDLAQKIDLVKIYHRPDADPLMRYPSPLFRASDEGFYRYFQRMLTVVVNNSTGVTTLRVQAFTAEDAQLVGQTLMGLGESLINRLNARMADDAVRVASDELARAQDKRIASQLAITNFRNKELVLDPAKSSEIVVELIGRLSGQLAETQTQIAQTEASSPHAPQLQTLRETATALARQIVIERSRVANSSDGLAQKIADYERLMLEREFSIRMLAAAATATETARTEARRQQLFLERVVEPGLPDEARMPRRWQMTATIFGFNIIGIGVLWLIIAGMSEHAGHRRR